MPLKIALKPHERLFVAGAAVVNGPTACELTILNDVPVLRDREILREKDADTPAKRVYLAVQLMYMDSPNLANYQQIFEDLAGEISQAAPSTGPLLEEIRGRVGGGEFYRALKACKRLVAYEAKLVESAQSQ